jgi:hypothetical protein
MESMETTCPGHRPFGTKVKRLALGVAAAAVLSAPALSAVAVVAGHDAARGPDRFNPFRFHSDSQRLALGVATPNSVRLT